VDGRCRLTELPGVFSNPNAVSVLKGLGAERLAPTLPVRGYACDCSRMRSFMIAALVTGAILLPTALLHLVVSANSDAVSEDRSPSERYGLDRWPGGGPAGPGSGRTIFLGANPLVSLLLGAAFAWLFWFATLFGWWRASRALWRFVKGG
jgi:hypothetical protein